MGQGRKLDRYGYIGRECTLQTFPHLPSPVPQRENQDQKNEGICLPPQSENKNKIVCTVANLENGGLGQASHVGLAQVFSHLTHTHGDTMVYSTLSVKEISLEYFNGLPRTMGFNLNVLTWREAKLHPLCRDLCVEQARTTSD
jgi:hypothetical protein